MSITWHKCRPESIKFGSSFLVSAKCKHSSCRLFKFFLTEKIILPHTDKYVYVNSNKDFDDHSAGEKHSRFIANQKREGIASLLKQKSPTAVRMDMINKANIVSMQEGNLTDTPSLSVLEKIISNERMKSDLYKDFNNYMRKLLIAYNDILIGKHIKGFIRLYSLYPFCIILFSEK